LELRSKADQILRQLDESDALKDKIVREYPTYDRSEILQGPVLGYGGFGVVFEIEAFQLREAGEEEMSKQDKARSSEDPNDESPSSSALAENGATADHHTADNTAAASLQLPALHEEEDERRGHYDVETARSLMASHVRRNGDARYAVKQLQHDLSELSQTRGMIDLAIEVKFLSVLWHPNISKFGTREGTIGKFASCSLFV
jgi:hypothetical protein